MDLSAIIDTLKLKPLPIEGGLYRDSYWSEEKLPDGRPMGSAIYYLLSGSAFSHLHLLDADEVYHFYLGDPVELTQINAAGIMTRTILGQDLAGGQQVQVLVPKGSWQGSRLLPGGQYALLGTTMSPSYTQAGYTHGEREMLLQQFPHLADAILPLTGEA